MGNYKYAQTFLWLTIACTILVIIAIVIILITPIDLYYFRVYIGKIFSFLGCAIGCFIASIIFRFAEI